MKIAFQMDELSGVSRVADSTFALMVEAALRGYEIFYYLPDALSYVDGVISAEGRWVSLSGDVTLDVEIGYGDIERVDLRDVDVILMRQDPPFDMSYITLTHLLDELHPKPFVVNNPSSVRNSPEKLMILRYRDLIPATLISRDYEAIGSFRAKHGDIIIKPLFGNGGEGIFRVKPDDVNMNSLLEMFFKNSREPVMVQEFLSDVSSGDKRVILCDGEPIGAINRVPPAGEIRSNMHIGGEATKTVLSERELEICGRLRDDLRAGGLIFVGIDIIGGYLTEINVTSPTGIQEAGRFDGVNLSGLLWDAIERHVG